MPADNLGLATASMRTAVSSLKKKLSNLKIQVEMFDAELEKIDNKFDNVLTQAEIYKSKLERELGREVRRLEHELTLLRKEGNIAKKDPTASEHELKIASSVAIFESILRLISQDAEDFKLISESFLFPAVVERIMSGEDDAYLLEETPVSASIVVNRGREHVAWLRSEYDTHLTDPETWAAAIEYVVEWWRNDALPLLYGSRDEQWDIDVPLTLTEMLTWRDVPAERPITFSSVFDAYEIYRKHKDSIYEPSGLRQFELKQFAFLP
jgi:archaellum component FlaC